MKKPSVVFLFFGFSAGIFFSAGAALPSENMKIEAVGNMVAPASQHRDILLKNGKVLLTGGQSGEGGIPDAQLYDPQSRTFSALPPMTEPRFVHAMNMLPNGRVLVSGGFSAAGQFLKSSEIFDGTGFVKGPDLVEARDNQRTYTLPDGRVFLEGGDNPEAGYIASTEIYDPVANDFIPGPMLPTGRAMDTISAYAGGKVLMAGGLKGVDFKLYFLSETVLYDPESNRVEPGMPLNEARKQHRATTLRDGRVLITGGINEAGDLKSVEIYGETDVKKTAEMLAARSEHCSVLLPNGSVFIAGGYSNGEYANTTEIFDPDNETFSPGPNMGTGRAFPMCTLLKDGSVLISGGTGVGGSLRSAELFQWQ